MRTSPRPNCAAEFKEDAAPGESASSCWKFRVAKGSSRIVCPCSDSPVVASAVCTGATSAMTSTFSSKVFAFRLTFNRVVSVTRTATSRKVVCAKLGALT